MIIKKNNGTIIVVTIISMFILTIIGFICLEMFVAQNILITTDVAKKRTFYAADGVVEMMRGYINKFYPENNVNSLDGIVPPSDDWTTASNAINSAIAGGYDVTKPTAPNVYARVELRRAPVLPNTLYVDFASTMTVQYYRIMGVSSTTINSNVIYSTVSYYFYVLQKNPPTGNFEKHFAGWREHKIIENDSGTIQ